MCVCDCDCVCDCVCTWHINKQIHVIYVLVNQVMCEPLWFCLAKPGFESWQSSCGPRAQAQLLAEPCCLRLKHLDLGCQDRQELPSQEKLLPLPHQNHPESSRINMTQRLTNSIQIQRDSNWFISQPHCSLQGHWRTTTHGHTMAQSVLSSLLSDVWRVSDTSPARTHHVKTVEIRTPLLSLLSGDHPRIATCSSSTFLERHDFDLASCLLCYHSLLEHINTPAVAFIFWCCNNTYTQNAVWSAKSVAHYQPL